MIKVIETNILFQNLEVPRDVQSRIIEIEDWEDYVKEVKEGRQVNRTSLLGSLYGSSMPKIAKIKYFDANEHRLICTFYRWDNTLQMKTAYVI